MEHGIKELKKLLNIFKNMSVTEYLDLYNKSLSMENIKIFDSFIDTDLTYAYNQNSNNIDLFNVKYSDIIVDKNEDYIFTFKSDELKAA
jgi:hypothetical protein